VVFTDPPYRLDTAYLATLLEELAGQGAVGPGSLIVLSRSTKSHMPVIPVNWTIARRLSYGDSIVLVYQAQ
jgi:16S rRNA (guanine966-N2)-methyltransferase